MTAKNKKNERGLMRLKLDPGQNPEEEIKKIRELAKLYDLELEIFTYFEKNENEVENEKTD